MTALENFPGITGLTPDEVAEHVARGAVNTTTTQIGRTTWDIVRDNVFTRINAILAVLFVMVMTTGSWINGAFGLLIIANSIIGIIQELRAKHTLDSLTLVGEARPRVLRGGELVELHRTEVVVDDVIALGPGDQVVVDGEVIATDALRMDESLLTGESDAVEKGTGDEVLSGSFVFSGFGIYRATRVGGDSYAAQLTAQASKFTLAHSELQAGINKILRYITWILIPVGIMLIISQVTGGATQWQRVILAITGALVPMVPEGLVLITSTAFALGVIRLGKRKCLVQELPAIEGLARVDVICADKTGTLTENRFECRELLSAPIVDAGADPRSLPEIREGIRQMCLADPAPNASIDALARWVESEPGMGAVDGDGARTDAFSADAAHVDAPTPIDRPVWEVVSREAFSSDKKWSGVEFLQGTWMLGAPDVLLDPESDLARRASEIAAQGDRVLAVATTSEKLADLAAGEAADLPSRIHPQGVVVLAQKVRSDAAQTLDYFKNQGVDVKVISGDNAKSVQAVVNSLGVDAGNAIDTRELSDEELARAVEENSIFGRVTPQQKRQMVAALQAHGHTVAMLGDGTNDVLALKDSDLGVAMGSGTAATRSVAKIVLLDDRFATMPHVLMEGRRVLANIERVAHLFLSKTIYSALLALLVVIAAKPFPFLPIHVTITGWFTIGIPAFLLSLAPTNERAQPGFVRRVMHFGLPAGAAVAAASFVTFLLVSREGSSPQVAMQESTAALVALIISATWILAVVARPYTWWKVALIALPLAGYGLIFTLPLTQRMFSLDSSNSDMMFVGIVLGLVGAAAVEAIWWIERAWKRRTVTSDGGGVI